jgi:hypothetical protein
MSKAGVIIEMDGDPLGPPLSRGMKQLPTNTSQEFSPVIGRHFSAC